MGRTLDGDRSTHLLVSIRTVKSIYRAQRDSCMTLFGADAGVCATVLISDDDRDVEQPRRTKAQ